MSKHNEHTFKEAIAQLLKTYKLDNRLDETSLVNSWEDVMGPMIAKHTKSIFINQHKLFVTLDSAALRNELSLAKTRIITMLNETAGKEMVKEIIFK